MTDLPLGIEPTLVSDQPAVVRSAIGEFMTSLWQAIAMIMAVAFDPLGIRAGAIVALSIPLTMATPPFRSCSGLGSICSAFRSAH